MLMGRGISDQKIKLTGCLWDEESYVSGLYSIIVVYF